MKQAILAFTLCLALSAALPTTKNSHKARISNGGRAVAGQFPWQALVLTDGERLCSGALIHPSWVVTSAGCVQLSFFYIVRLGALDLYDFELQINTTEAIIHEDYDFNEFVNPIALINLGQNVTLSANIQVIPLAPENIGTGVTLTASGYGEESNAAYGSLLFGEMQTITNDICYQEYFWYIHEETLCTAAGPNQHELCLGDLGNPLVRNADTEDAALVAVAVVIGGMRCPTESSGVFLRMSPYIDWIERTIRQN